MTEDEDNSEKKRLLKDHMDRLQDKKTLLTNKLEAIAKKLRIFEPTINESIYYIRK